jgi:hypothetical protein
MRGSVMDPDDAESHAREYSPLSTTGFGR